MTLVLQSMRRLTARSGDLRGSLRREAAAIVLLIAILAALFPAGVFAANDPDARESTRPYPPSSDTYTAIPKRQIGVGVADTSDGRFWRIDGIGFSAGWVEIVAVDGASNPVTIFTGVPVASGPMFSLMTTIPYCKGNPTTGVVRVTAREIVSGIESETEIIPITC